MALGSRYRERNLDEIYGTELWPGQGQSSNKPVEPIPVPLGVYRQYVDNVVVDIKYLHHTGITPALRLQRTWDQVNPGPPYVTGGPFSSLRILHPIAEGRGNGTYSRTVGNTRYEYQGGFYLPAFDHDPIPMADLANMGWNSGQNSSQLPDPEASYGSGVFDRLRPQLSDGGLGVALAELRDVPRMLSTSARGFHEIWKSMGGHQTAPFMQPKKVADHFLNQQFGWVPFVADVGKFSDNFRHGRVKIDNLSRNNNTWIKRERTILNSVGDWNMDWLQWGFSGCQPPASSYMANIFTYSAHSVYSRLVDKVWAEGRFKFYRPELDRSLTSYDDKWPAMQRQMLLHGARINPSVLWRATPWTWLIDWGFNVGKLIDHIEAVGLDGIVSKYLYLMEHKQRQIVSFHDYYGSDNGFQQFSWSRFQETKQRVEAGNPYGFGLSWGGLSPMKLAILAALGISRR